MSRRTHPKAKTRHPMIRIIDEVIRLKSRLQSTFADARAATGLSPMESTVLTAVVEAQSPPTVSKIGRSLGNPRQVVQRAANRLIDAKLLQAIDNPDHKRAPLLHATSAGERLHREAESASRKTADSLAHALGLKECERLADDLHNLRSEIEAHLKNKRSLKRR
jgi:DNA-binding MarR family transcriptional regulator